MESLAFLLIILIFLLMASYILCDRDMMAPDVLYIAGFVLAVIAASMNVSAWGIDLSAKTIMIILIGTLSFVTLHAVQNYGSVLQALATQEILKQHGCDVTIIDYVREDVRYENLVKKWSGGNPIKALAIIPTILRWKNVFQSFTKKYLDLSENTYTTEDDFESYPLDADAYCTGSDQVEQSELELMDVELNRAIEHNHQLKHPSIKPKAREIFFEEIKKGKNFNAIVRKLYPKQNAKQIVKMLLIKAKIIGGYDKLWNKLCYEVNVSVVNLDSLMLFWVKDVGCNIGRIPRYSLLIS